MECFRVVCNSKSGAWPQSSIFEVTPALLLERIVSGSTECTANTIGQVPIPHSTRRIRSLCTQTICRGRRLPCEEMKLYQVHSTNIHTGVQIVVHGAFSSDARLSINATTFLRTELTDRYNGFNISNHGQTALHQLNHPEKTTTNARGR